MKEWRGLYLPDGETHLIEWMQKVNHIVDGKPTYQYHKLEAALKWVKNWRVAIDVGAHCGLLAMHLAKRFEWLEAYEPVASHRECLAKNMNGIANYEVHPFAVGEKDGSVSIHTAPTSSGDSWVDGVGDIPMVRIDDEGWANIDFIKLDTEGYELFALRGAEKTLLRCKPCVLVEQKPGKAQQFNLPETGAVDYLQSLGAKLRTSISGDYIFSWD